MVWIMVTEGEISTKHVIHSLQGIDPYGEFGDIQKAALTNNLLFIAALDDGYHTIINSTQLHAFKREIEILRSVDGLNQVILDQLENAADAIDPKATPQQYLFFLGD